MSKIADCTVEPLDTHQCLAFLSWLRGADSMPEGAAGFRWALNHLDDGVTWGRYDASVQSWFLGDQVAHRLSPPVRHETLQELRVFGPEREVLLWRTPAGLRGRIVVDLPAAGTASENTSPTAPTKEARILMGEHIASVHEPGFTYVSDRRGASQLLPLKLTAEALRAHGARLLVRHYYERDLDTGAVRIALTRLVGLQGGLDDA